MKTVIGVLGWMWAAPYTVPTLLITLLLVAFGQLRLIAKTDYLMLVWAPRDGSWLLRYFKRGNWRGFGFGCNLYTTLRPSHPKWGEMLKHEEMHCFQQYVLGILFWVFYVLASVFILVFLRKRHAYYDNPFEKQARKYAMQPVVIAQEKWGKGGVDRWPWW